MPLYEAKCPNCGKRYTYIAKVTTRENTPECSTCHVPSIRQLSAPAGYVDNPRYMSQYKKLY